MHLPDLVLHEPGDLAEAGALLARLGSRARVMAGGTDLLPDLKTGRMPPCELVSIARIGALRGIEPHPGSLPRPGAPGNGHVRGLRIGALTTLADLEESPLLTGPFAAIGEAARGMAAPQVRNAATVGGNIAGAVPCADLPPVLGVLDASVILWSSLGTRAVTLASYFRGPRQADRRADEILTEVLVPPPPDRFGAAYFRFALRSGNAIAVAGAAAALELRGDGLIHAARIMLSAVAPVPRRVPEAERSLAGRRLDDAIDRAAEDAAAAADPISDVRGSAAYRRELVGVLVRRALRAAQRRAIGGGP